MSGYTFYADLGGAPYDEDCAQLGHTPSFTRINILEAQLYRAALIAVHGPPPEGVRMRLKANPHNFGTYHTIIAEYSALEERKGQIIDYLNAIDSGIARWHDACFAPPDWTAEQASGRPLKSLADRITGAITATRPRPDGSFFPPEFQSIHANLRSAFPESAARSDEVFSTAKLDAPVQTGEDRHEAS